MFRTTIREWLLVVVIVAVGASWWADRITWSQRLLQSEKALSESREALAASETFREDAVRANGVIVDLLKSWGYSVHLPEEVYVERRSKQR
ncbi:MAG TPA: hypothetical protein VMP01_17595 [Pirellulaceae bacterium]|nr:hypothetical protein [Pirellulaceae bacterium]